MGFQIQNYRNTAVVFAPFRFGLRVIMGVGAIQLPRVIERGVGVNDSREFELYLGCHWQQGGEGCT